MALLSHFHMRGLAPYKYKHPFTLLIEHRCLLSRFYGACITYSRVYHCLVGHIKNIAIATILIYPGLVVEHPQVNYICIVEVSCIQFMHM